MSGHWMTYSHYKNAPFLHAFRRASAREQIFLWKMAALDAMVGLLFHVRQNAARPHIGFSRPFWPRKIVPAYPSLWFLSADSVVRWAVLYWRCQRRHANRTRSRGLAPGGRSRILSSQKNRLYKRLEYDTPREVFQPWATASMSNMICGRALS